MFDIGTKEEKDDMQKQKYAFELHEEVSDKEFFYGKRNVGNLYFWTSIRKYRNLIKNKTTISSFDLNHTGVKKMVNKVQKQEEYINK